MPKMSAHAEKPVSRRLERQVRSIVNELLMMDNCAGCGKRLSIHDMDTDVESGASYCIECVQAPHSGQSR